jgi:hypothetical protein
MVLYESKQDLENEERLMKHICPNHPYKKLDQFDLDYEIIGKCFIEIKCYNSFFYESTTQVISMIKLLTLQKRDKILPTYLFAQYQDGIWYIACKDIEGYFRYTGRKPRSGSTNDHEMLVFVDKSKFRKFTQNK